MHKLLIAFSIISFAVVSFGKPLTPKMKSENPNGTRMVTIPNTEVRTIKSKYTNDQYDIYFYIPTYYDKKEKVPLFVMPDAFFKFGIACDMIRILQDGGLVKPFIVAGIDYGCGWGQKGNNRGRDMTFKAHEKDTNTGGADKYIEFLGKEFIPFALKHYSIDTTDMTFCGASLGGTFGAYLMFQKDRKIFQKFILNSPALCYYNNDLLEVEEAYSKNSTSLPIDLYITMGSNEDKNYMVPCFYKFCGALEKRKYEGLNFKMIIGYEQIHHTNEMNLLPKILMQIYALNQ